MLIYHKKIATYTGKCKVDYNKKGIFISGKFRLTIYSNGHKELKLIVNGKPSKKVSHTTLRNIRLRFIGSDRKGRRFRAALFYNGMTQRNFSIQSIKFMAVNVIVAKGRFSRGEKEIYYYINNMTLSRLRYKTAFIINNKKYDILPYNYSKGKKILEKHGGSQTTSVIECKDTSIYFPNKDETIPRLLYLLSFYTANYVSLDRIEIWQNNHNYKMIFFNDKRYPYVKGYNILDFTITQISEVIEKTYPKFNQLLKKIDCFENLIEVYIESLNATVIETKFAIIAMLFEGLKSRYIDSGIISKYKQDKHGDIVRDGKGKKIKKVFREILEDIFKLEKFRYSRKGLKSLIEIRNLVIHEVKSKDPSRKITFKKTQNNYYTALNLFERFVLKLIGFKGHYHSKTPNKGFVLRKK